MVLQPEQAPVDHISVGPKTRRGLDIIPGRVGPVPNTIQRFKRRVAESEPAEKLLQRMFTIAENIVRIIKRRIDVRLVPDVECNQASMCCVPSCDYRKEPVC